MLLHWIFKKGFDNLPKRMKGLMFISSDQPDTLKVADRDNSKSD